jgi:glycosyltransferase 2 family protein
MWWLIARLLVSGGLLALFFVPLPANIPVVSRLLPHQLSLATISNQLTHASAPWLLAATLITAPVIVLVSWKWQILLRGLGVRERLPRLIRMNLVGGFYSLVLPGEETGQLAKGVLLARHSEGDAVAASIVVDEILGTLSVFTIALVALMLTRPFPLRWPITTALLVMLSLFAAVLVLILVPRFHRVFRSLVERGLPAICAALVWPLRPLFPSAAHRFVSRGTVLRTRILLWLEPFWVRLADYHRNPGPLIAAFLITVIAHLLANVSAYATMHSVQAGVSYLDVCWIYAAISALVTIPITISGFGVREQANVRILGPLGVNSGQALAISLLAFAIGFVWSLPGALLQFGIRSKGRPLPSPEEPLGEVAAGSVAR